MSLRNPDHVQVLGIDTETSISGTTLKEIGSASTCQVVGVAQLKRDLSQTNLVDKASIAE